MGHDVFTRLRNFSQTLAFCLVISALQAFLEPRKSYLLFVVYSVSIGTATWALVDFGRRIVDPESDAGWPRGGRVIALMAGSIPLGFVLGTAVADAWLGNSSWHGEARQQLVKSMLITMVAGIVVSYYFYSKGRGAHLARRAEQAQRDATEARLRLLEVQLEPHMLFNTLANLRALVGTDAARAERMLDHLIAYLRATLGGSRAVLHPLADEFDRLADFLALMQVRMGPRLAYALHLPPALAAVPVPPLLLQPLVENSIRHGLEPQLAGGRVEVSACVEGTGRDALLVLQVRDSGIGLPAQPAAAGGFGTEQVRQRLATAYGTGAGIALSADAPRGTCARVWFPVQAEAFAARDRAA